MSAATKQRDCVPAVPCGRLIECLKLGRACCAKNIPHVSTLLAIDYSLGHGLQPFWFHLSIFALFVALTLLLAFVLYRLIDPPTDGFASPSGSALRAGSAVNNLWIALAAAAWYGLH